MHLEVHRAEDRGTTKVGWLYSRHSFSFNEYYNPKRMNFGALQVLNDDLIEPGMGFPAHPHQDMEILTIVLSGRLEHRDSKGHHGFVKAGEIQRMSAGSGITHSEQNASETEPLSLLQIWIEPKRKGLEPSYEQHPLPNPERGFAIIASDERDGTTYIRQKAKVLLGRIPEGTTEGYHPQNPYVYIFLISGALQIAGTDMGERDAAAIKEAKHIDMTALQDAEVLIFDVPAKHSA